MTQPIDYSEIDLHELLRQRRQIAHIWSFEDVQDVRRDLNDDQAWAVLQDCVRYLDSNYGITWETIDIVADLLFPKASQGEDA